MSHFGVSASVRLSNRRGGAFGVLKLVCAVIGCFGEVRDWYCRVPGAAIPVRMLSSVLNPGTDGECLMRHRMLTLGKRMQRTHDESSPVLEKCEEVLKELCRRMMEVFPWYELRELPAQFRSLVDYSLTAVRRRHDEARFRQIVEEKIEVFLSSWKKIAEYCREEECTLLGVENPSAYARRTEAKLDEIQRNVKPEKGRGRPIKISVQTKKWLVEIWLDLNRSPFRVKNNVAGRRVVVLDAWETYREAAMERGIRTQKDYERAHRSAMDAARAGKLGEEYRLKVRRTGG